MTPAYSPRVLSTVVGGSESCNHVRHPVLMRQADQGSCLQTITMQQLCDYEILNCLNLGQYLKKHYKFSCDPSQPQNEEVCDDDQVPGSRSDLLSKYIFSADIRFSGQSTCLKIYKWDGHFLER